MTNLTLWDHVEKTDPSFTKEFNRGGGFKGTAINPTYLARKATEVFGPVGIGWGWKIIHEEMLEGAKLNEFDVEKTHTLRVQVWYKLGEDRGELEHFGATTYVGKNKFGTFTDEEAKKKSLTDAIGKCLSLLGFSADVHLGRYDDNKYVNDRKIEVENEKKQVTDETIKSVFDRIESCKSEQEVRAYYPAAKMLLMAVGNSPLKTRLDQVCKDKIESIKSK